MGISIRKLGVGRSIRVSKPVFLVQKQPGSSPLEVELQLAKDVLSRVISPNSIVDSLLVVGSLPRVHRNMLGASLAHSVRADFCAVTEFSGGCGSVVDALHHLFCSADPDESHALVVTDSFLSSYEASSGGMQWSDGGAALLVSPNGAIPLKLRAYVSSHQAEFLPMAHDVGEEIAVPFLPHHLKNFSEVDEEMIRVLFKASLDFAGLTMSDLDCVIVPNRSGEALYRVQKVLNSDIEVFESRLTFSHSGAADILINLSLALNAMRCGVFCLLGFGLGYSWRIMILEVG